MIRVGARQMQLQTLPYWDWTHWFDDNCIVNNPFYQEERLSKSDCEGCADIDEIEREEELTHDDMAQTFLLAYIPLIITDAIQDWKAYKIFDTEYVTKLFLEDPVLSAGTICSFYNENVKHKYVKDVLRSIDNGTTTQWNMHWQNCMDTARKTFRRFYSRPYCIPPMVEMMNSNWLFMSSGVNKQQLSKLPYVRSLDTGVSMTWFAQLKGSYEIKLKPHEICEEDCEVMTAILQPGELLVFSNIMWKFEFRVASEKDVIAIAANGNWD
uniref:Uncharacterized protein LOC100373668 n=1 Tax=Saccoglossus kowalevskii TaxID=10224 RepID=A0ABM0GRX1_SACKO|nr:PREDICTED: uncharacterized protein LOC100373668 [Saccoglossus kowalevskii]